MNNLDKKQYFEFLDKWFQIFPEPKLTPDKVDKELVDIAKEQTTSAKQPTQ